MTLDTNRYSVPAEYASCSLQMKRLPERIELLYKGKTVASHVRSYARRQDLTDSAHEMQLLTVRRHARAQKLPQRFMRLSACAERYCAMLRERRPNWRDQPPPGMSSSSACAPATLFQLDIATLTASML